jgi:hypothetical protein
LEREQYADKQWCVFQISKKWEMLIITSQINFGRQSLFIHGTHEEYALEDNLEVRVVHWAALQGFYRPWWVGSPQSRL